MNDNPEQWQSEEELTQPLRAFLGDPTSPGAVRGWYAEIAKRCPLWTLQYFYYLSNHVVDLSKEHSPLVEDLSFRLMARPSRDEAALRTFVSSDPPPEPFTKCSPPDAREPFAFAPLPKAHSVDPWMRFAPRFLLQSYRFVLMNPKHDLRALTIALLAQQDPDVPADYWTPPADQPFFSQWFGSHVAELVAVRDLLPVGPKREEADRRLKRFLTTTKVLRGAGHKASIPQSEWFVKNLANECLAWLKVLMVCRDTALSQEATEKLASWGCDDTPQRWAKRLAFPFLSEQELVVVEERARRSKKDRTEPAAKYDLDLTLVYFIYARIGGILSPRTVADHIHGASWAIKHKQRLDRDNPFLD